MRIIHVFRGAVGGLFRHVCDQVAGQSAEGHDVGIFCDSLTGGSFAAAKLEILAPLCTLGIKRVAMKTLPGLSDVDVIRQMVGMARDAKADILHGHGAKGGLYARLAAKRLGLASAYVPHGGSLHYEWKNPKGAVFLTAEKLLRVKRSGLIFVCEFERDAYDKKIGIGSCASTVIYNGLAPDDFAPRKLDVGASDFFFVGEMRSIKGVDILLKALAEISLDHRPSLTLVGDGPEESEFRALAISLGLGEKVTFAGRKSMRDAMRLGRTLVVPSRRESFPYVVIEAMAAGIPVIASDVGGIKEALPENRLFGMGSVSQLAAKLSREIQHIDANLAEAASLRKVAGERFSTKRMVADTLNFYGHLI